MRNETRKKFNALTHKIGQLNGVGSVSHSFNVAPAVAQTLRAKVQASSSFLSQINIIAVVAQEGDKIGVGVKGTIAGRTDTRTKDRVPRYPGDLDETRYRCEQTNFDTMIRYETLDAWAHQPNFQILFRDAVIKAQALDKITIGFNGTHVARDTDPVANPLLQDVNIGWLEHIRIDAPASVLNDGALTTGATKAIYVAAGVELVDADATNVATARADYVNIDALVYDAIELLDELYRDDTDLVVICGRSVVHDKYFGIVNAAADDAGKQIARDVLLSDKKIGGLQAVRVPKFPSNALLITTLANLSIYDQIGTERRKVEDNSKRDQVENYESVNEAYVVEDMGKAALVENIKIGPKPAA